MILRAQINKAMPLLAAAVAAIGVDFQIFSPDSPPPPSCKHIWDAMVGLVSAFGGKFGFSIFCFKKETLIKHLFRELYKRPTDTLVGSDFLRRNSLRG